jgi:hypothetical protein
MLPLSINASSRFPPIAVNGGTLFRTRQNGIRAYISLFHTGKLVASRCSRADFLLDSSRERLSAGFLTIPVPQLLRLRSTVAGNVLSES